MSLSKRNQQFRSTLRRKAKQDYFSHCRQQMVAQAREIQELIGSQYESYVLQALANRQQVDFQQLSRYITVQQQLISTEFSSTVLSFILVNHREASGALKVVQDILCSSVALPCLENLNFKLCIELLIGEGNCSAKSASHIEETMGVIYCLSDRIKTPQAQKSLVQMEVELMRYAGLKSEHFLHLLQSLWQQFSLLPPFLVMEAMISLSLGSQTLNDHQQEVIDELIMGFSGRHKKSDQWMIKIHPWLRVKMVNSQSLTNRYPTVVTLTSFLESPYAQEAGAATLFEYVKISQFLLDCLNGGSNNLKEVAVIALAEYISYSDPQTMEALALQTPLIAVLRDVSTDSVSQDTQFYILKILGFLLCLDTAVSSSVMAQMQNWLQQMSLHMSVRIGQFARIILDDTII